MQDLNSMRLGWLLQIGGQGSDILAETCADLWEEQKAMTNLDIILKNREVTLPTKVCILKTTVFPVAICGYEGWTIKKAENRRTDAFELGVGEDS